MAQHNLVEHLASTAIASIAIFNTSRQLED